MSGRASTYKTNLNLYKEKLAKLNTAAATKQKNNAAKSLKKTTNIPHPSKKRARTRKNRK
jgi:hypothetical protein